MDASLLEIAGAPQKGNNKYTALATFKFIGGLMTQRSPFESIDTRYNTRYLGGKPDALITGSNVEISNKNILQRRPGVVPYGTASIPAPIAFYEWQLSAPPSITLVVDTASALYNYSPTGAGIYFNKANLSNQTVVFNIVNTLYAGDGVDAFKITGPNLLIQSNTFSNAAWTDSNFTLAQTVTDPNNVANNAWKATPTASGTSTKLEQTPTIQYAPVGSNTFTFSVYMKLDNAANANTVSLRIEDQAANTIIDTPQVLTGSWVKYQVSGTSLSSATGLNVYIYNPTTTNAIDIYGAQLEIGSPATPTQVTTTKQQGVWLWGISAPTSAPTLTFSNTGNVWQPNHVYHLGDTIIDSNGNLETVTNAGTSGSVQPTWMTTKGAITFDGTQGIVVQSGMSSNIGSTTASFAFGQSVTATNQILVFISVLNQTGTPSVSDTQTDSFTQIANQVDGAYDTIYAFWCSSAAGGTTTVNVSGGGSDWTWMATAEISGITSLDVHATNHASNSLGTSFATGQITTTGTTEFVITFGFFITSQNASSYVGQPPSGQTQTTNFNIQIASQTGINAPLHLSQTHNYFENLGVFATVLTATATLNPTWTIINPAGQTGAAGITIGFHTSVGTLQWTNGGPDGLTTTSGTTGYSYYYAFMNAYTGHISNVSPLSAQSGVIVGQTITVSGVGMQITVSGPHNQDPQVDTIVIFRNTAGGGFWFQVAQIPNPGSTSSPGTWTLNDFAPDNGNSVTDTYTLNGGSATNVTAALNTALSAPIGLINSIPPTGITNMEFFESRMWGSVNNQLYYSAQSDNASLLNITFNGVSAEAWPPGNVIPFNAPITRILNTAYGLLVFTTSDIWAVQGTSITNGGFNAVRAFPYHGLRSYNSLAIDGSNLMIYTGDRELLMLNPSAGSLEVGFAIGDVVESAFDPTKVYIARHIKGSQDNAFYVADGSTGWYRLNPNQVGASVSGEQTPVWSPFATITGGLGAIASIETTPGVHTLLCGQTSTGVVLARSITTFTDNGTPYSWSATIGSILLASPGTIAEIESITTEMNNISSAATQCGVAVLLDEISGTFESLPNSIPDPVYLPTSHSVLSVRFDLRQGTAAPICRHMQIQLTGTAVATKDELLSLTIRGALQQEQV